MLNIATLLWKANSKSHGFSSVYDESWVTKLHQGFARNLTVPFRLCLFVDHYRQLDVDATQYMLRRQPITYGSCMEVYRLNEPMIVVGLDTIIVRNIDHWAKYALDPQSEKVLVPMDPYRPDRFCNGVQIVPAGFGDFYDAWNGENDMDFIRRARDVADIDSVFPGQAISYKVHYAPKKDLGRARVVYFHGKPKMHQIEDKELLEHWR